MRFRPSIMVLLTFLTACEAAQTADVGEHCSVDSDCATTLCLFGVCADPLDDPDHDGLSSGNELRLGLDPLNPDTDHDDIADGREVGYDLDSPLDFDADGLIDAVESAIEDQDSDCLPDQFDPHDEIHSATEADVVRHRCSELGICGAYFDLVEASCAAGEVQCRYDNVPGYRLDDDHCDGLDNDCDGDTDEGFLFDGLPVGTPCKAVGECGSGVVECADDMLGARCSSGVGGSDDRSVVEVCDHLDNDCDGETDENLELDGIAIGEACVGRGTCGDGVIECGLSGAMICSSEAGGSDDRSDEETCNDLDDDCDGDTDENIEPIVFTGECVLRGICLAHVEQVRIVCSDGEPVCDFSGVDGYSGSGEALCDGFDDDCDGLVDEDDNFAWLDPVLGWRRIGQSCGLGACAGGTVICSVDQVTGVCSSTGMASSEVCDDIDNDCNGMIDDDLVKDFGTTLDLLALGEPRGRVNPAIVAVEQGEPSGVDGIYVYGGASRIDSSGTLSMGIGDFWKYDLSAHRFELLESRTPGPRIGANLVHDPVRGLLVLVGGASDGTPSSLWAWDLAQSSWIELPVAMPQDRVVAATLDPDSGLVFVVSEDETGALVGILIDPVGVVSDTVHYTTKLLKNSAVAVGESEGTVFLYGGVGDDGAVANDLFLLRPSGEETACADLPKRRDHGLVAMGDGSLLTLGGTSADGAVVKTVSRFDRSARDGCWASSLAGSLFVTGGLTRPGLIEASNAVYVYSGVQDDGNALRKVMRFEQTQWTSDLLSRRPSGRAWGAMAVLRDQRTAFLFGGIQDDLPGNVPVRDVWKFLLDNNQFSQVVLDEEPPAMVRGAIAVDEVANRVFMIGGLDGLEAEGAGPSGRFVRFSTDSLIFEDLPPGPADRVGHAAVWTKGGLFVVGGRTLGDGPTGLCRFTDEGGWTVFPEGALDREGLSLFWDQASQRLIAVGGSSSGTVVYWDPEGLTWRDWENSEVFDTIESLAVFDDVSQRIWQLDASSGLGMVLDVSQELIGHSSFELGVAVSGASAGYDPVFRRVLLFGGQTENGFRSSLRSLSQTCPIDDR